MSNPFGDTSLPERWKEIPGYEGLYNISNYGRVQRISSRRIINLADNGMGYYKVGLCKNGLQKWFFVHRIVAEAFIANPDNLPEVNHKDTNGYNNLETNLEWVTKTYNAQYSHAIPVIVYRNKKAIGTMSRIEALSLVGCCETTLQRMYDEGLEYNGYELIRYDMTLAMMYKNQQMLQDRLHTMDFETEKDRTLFIKHHAQYLDQELHEMMRELQFFKDWKQYDWDDDVVQQKWQAAREEFVDVVHFFINIALALDLSPEELTKEYLAKNHINHVRQDNNY